MSVRNLEDYTEEQLQELADNITDEEFEQLDELSKQTLSSYMGKAVSDIQDTQTRRGKAPLVRGPEGKKLRDKRAAGMRTAGKKWLNKEETDEVADPVNNDEDENLEETAALDTIKPKSVHMADIIKKMSGMNNDDITKLAGILNQIGHEADKLPAGANAAANKNSVAAKGSAVAGSHTIGAVKEDLAAMFGEDTSELSEDFMNKTTTLFEAAVNLRVDVIREEVYEEASAIVEEMVNERVEEITEQLDKYLESVVDKWLEENAIAVETSIRTVKAEAFLEDLSALFEEHNITIPEESTDIVESLMGEVEELKGRLNEALEANIENAKLIEQAERDEVFDEIAEGLTDTQAEKLRTLVEGLEAGDLDEYRTKVTVVKEQHFKEVKTSNIGNEIDSIDPAPQPKKLDGDMARYSEAISKVIKNS